MLVNRPLASDDGGVRWNPVRGLLFAVTLLVAACGGSSSGLVESSSGLATEEPLATEAPASDAPVADATTKPNSSPLNVRVTSYTKSVRAGSNASFAVATNPGADCTITVEYYSGISTAAGLEPKKAGTTGNVVWKWKVGSHTTPGSWPITVQCDHGDRTATVTRNFTVK